MFHNSEEVSRLFDRIVPFSKRIANDGRFTEPWSIVLTEDTAMLWYVDSPSPCFTIFADYLSSERADFAFWKTFSVFQSYEIPFYHSRLPLRVPGWESRIHWTVHQHEWFRVGVPNVHDWALATIFRGLSQDWNHLELVKPYLDRDLMEDYYQEAQSELDSMARSVFHEHWQRFQ
jgi:hypothetical protein